MQLRLRAGGHLALTDFHYDRSENFAYGFAVDDSTINIVLVLSLLL